VGQQGVAIRSGLDDRVSSRDSHRRGGHQGTNVWDGWGRRRIHEQVGTLVNHNVDLAGQGRKDERPDSGAVQTLLRGVSGPPGLPGGRRV